MSISMPRTKLCVRDVQASAGFYKALGFKVARTIEDTHGPEGDNRKVRQSQIWVSETGDETSHIIILSQFLDLPRPKQIEYPGDAWPLFRCTNVDETIEAAKAANGSVIVPANDVPGIPLRAAVIGDNEGRPIEIIGPKNGG